MKHIVEIYENGWNEFKTFAVLSDAQRYFAMITYEQTKERFRLRSEEDGDRTGAEVSGRCKYWDCGFCYNTEADYGQCYGSDKCEWYQNNKGE